MFGVWICTTSMTVHSTQQFNTLQNHLSELNCLFGGVSGSGGRGVVQQSEGEWVNV